MKNQLQAKLSNEENFFKSLKAFLLDLKTKNTDIDVVSLYQSLIQSKDQLTEIFDECINELVFTYERDNSGFSSGTLILIPNRNVSTKYGITLTHYGETKLTIAKYSEAFADYLELDEDSISKTELEWFRESKEIEKALLIDKLVKSSEIIKKAMEEKLALELQLAELNEAI
jgi:hypothetical protein